MTQKHQHTVGMSVVSLGVATGTGLAQGQTGSHLVLLQSTNELEDPSVIISLDQLVDYLSFSWT